jgi:hypothetical protein
MTRLELQVKLITKFGNTLNNVEKKRFETFHLRTLKIIPSLLEKFTSVEKEGDQEVTHNILSAEIKVNSGIVVPLFIALQKLSLTDFKNEVLGDILCYEPALMPGSETTIAYTSWGLAFRFDQEAALSENAAQFFIDMGFTLGADKDNKQYFIYNAEKLLKS